MWMVILRPGIKDRRPVVCAKDVNRCHPATGRPRSRTELYCYPNRGQAAQGLRELAKQFPRADYAIERWPSFKAVAEAGYTLAWDRDHGPVD